MLLAQGQHLAHDDVEEGEPVLHRQQRLGLVEPHRRGQPAVELDHRRGRERVRGHLRIDVEVVEFGQVGDGLDVVLVDEPGLPGLQLGVVVAEDGNGLSGGPVVPHQGDGGV